MVSLSDSYLKDLTCQFVNIQVINNLLFKQITPCFKISFIGPGVGGRQKTTCSTPRGALTQHMIRQVFLPGSVSYTGGAELGQEGPHSKKVINYSP